MRFLVIALVALSSIEVALSANCLIESFEYAPYSVEEFCVLKGLKTEGPVAGDPSITRVVIINSSLKRLSAAFYERFPRLEHLVVRNSDLEFLHITGNVRIIDASRNKIKSVSVQSGRSMQELNLRSNPINDFGSIGGLLGLTKLNIGDTFIKADEFSFDLTALCHLVNLTELYLDDLDLFYLDNTRKCNLSNVRVLDLSRNSFIPHSFKLDLFRTMPRLEVFILRNCLVSNPNAHLEELRTDFPSLKQIYLEGNRFTCPLLREMLDLLKANGIEAVEPDQSEFCDVQFIHIAKMCCAPSSASSAPLPGTNAGITTAQLLEELDLFARLELALRNLKRTMKAQLIKMREKDNLLSSLRTLLKSKYRSIF